MLPQTNGRLLQVDSPGQSVDWDESAGADIPKWTGVEHIYTTMTINSVFSESEGALVRFRTDVIRMDEAFPVDILEGDTLTWLDYAGREHSNRVQIYTHPSLPQIPTGFTYVKLTMEATKVES